VKKQFINLKRCTIVLQLHQYFLQCYIVTYLLTRYMYQVINWFTCLL